MVKVFVMYRLKDGVNSEDYAKWSREIDQQIIPRLRGVIRFETYAIDAADQVISAEKTARYQYIDDIEVEDWDIWQASLSTPAAAEVVRQWLEFADESTIHIVYGHRIIGGIDVLEVEAVS
jgi:hypothetical protein